MRIPLVGRIRDQYREWLTPRGRYLLWLTAALALAGLNTRDNQAFKVFAVGAGLLGSAVLFAVLRPPRERLICRLPARATSNVALEVPIGIERPASPGTRPLLVSFPRTPRVWMDPPQQLVADPAVRAARVTLRAERRGRYLLRGPTLRGTDPLGLVGSRAAALDDQILLVYPRFFSMESFRLPLGRRYQPGGIPLASHTGDSLEFLGTREYRQGDPIKHLHWRSWARLGAPVVKEFQEEFFCRIAIVLDTFLPRTNSAADEQAFEAAISVVASITDYFSRGEYIVDIFAAGPDIYQVSAARSLAYLENILDVLACIEPCEAPPFDLAGPVLFDKLAQITSVVAVVLDWDASREQFLQRVRASGCELRVLVVREGKTTKDIEESANSLGDITQVRPSEVAQALDHPDGARAIA
jgi:uncharacterized protein (DUF58 family)